MKIISLTDKQYFELTNVLFIWSETLRRSDRVIVYHNDARVGVRVANESIYEILKAFYMSMELEDVALAAEKYHFGIPDISYPVVDWGLGSCIIDLGNDSPEAALRELASINPDWYLRLNFALESATQAQITWSRKKQ